MSDLDDVLKRHDFLLAASLRDADEFDKPSARAAVRRRRTTRTVLTAAASVAALAAVGAGGWLAYGAFDRDALPAVTSSATPSPTASASASPSPTATEGDAVAGPCPSRAATITSEGAALVAASPSTGESWLDMPVAIDTPAAAGESGSYSAWVQLGTRGGNDIVAGFEGVVGTELYELSPDGTLTWIQNPQPGFSDPRASDPYSVAAHNAEQCYESLALPTSITLADDTQVEVASRFWWGRDVGGIDPSEGTVVDTWGRSRVIRMDSSDAASFAPGLYEAGYSTGPVSAVSYWLITALGTQAQIDFDALAGADAIVPGVTFTDFFDLSCETTLGEEIRLTATQDSDWNVAGSVKGREFAVATATSPFAQERYQAYADHADTQVQYGGDAPMSFDEWLALPGLVGMRSDEGGWWAQINQDVSPRYWC